MIGKSIPLKKKGNSYFACCPFHHEKTPSFSVHPQRQSYHCFGCGRSGDAISFIREHEHLDFVPALERLADLCGLSLSALAPKPAKSGRFKNSQQEVPLGNQNERDEAYALNKEVADFFQRQLKTHPFRAPALAYLEQRGFSWGPLLEQFGVGLSVPQNNALIKALSQKYSGSRQLKILTLAQDLGLVALGETHQELYDKFRARIMFPVHDLQGRVLGFGGRLFDATSTDHRAKYLNSSDSVLFHKGEILFGLYQIRHFLPEAITTQLPVVVVEGYFDVLRLMQGHIPAVASMGTALTEKQFQLLTKYYKNLCFCFDGDEAGHKAAVRVLEWMLPFLEDGLRVRFLTLDPGEDPDSYIKKRGHSAFLERLQKAQDVSDFFFVTLMADLNLNFASDRASAAVKIKPRLNSLPPGTFKRLMFNKFHELLGLNYYKNGLTYKNRKEGRSGSPGLVFNPGSLTINHLGAKALQLLTRYHESWSLDKLALNLEELHAPALFQRVQAKTEYVIVAKIIVCLKSDKSVGLASIKALLTEEELNIWQRLHHSDDLFKHMSAQQCQQEWEALVIAINNSIDKERRMLRIEKLLSKQKSSNLSSEEKHELLALLSGGSQ